MVFKNDDSMLQDTVLNVGKAKWVWEEDTISKAKQSKMIQHG